MSTEKSAVARPAAVLLPHARVLSMGGGLGARLPDPTIGPSSQTHSFNANRRFVPLSFTVAGNSITAVAPASTFVAPRGYYMLFVLDDRGIPSVAAIVRVG